MPAKADEAPSPRRERESPSFRRPDPNLVRDAALRALRASAHRYASQRSFREAVLPLLRREDPTFRLGGRRLRTLLLGVPGIRLTVRYAERPTRRPLAACPVCGSAIRPIRNQTLLGEAIVLGYACTRCDYWTHLRRRVPVRYRFDRATETRARRKP